MLKIFLKTKQNDSLLTIDWEILQMNFPNQKKNIFHFQSRPGKVYLAKLMCEEQS